jgi:outer membrane protein insertion porin family
MSLVSFILKSLTIYFFLITLVFSEVIEKIIVNGNNRISDETVIMFSNVSIKDEITNNKLNLILKDLYKTNYFENVNVLLDDKILQIEVKEHPIIQKIIYTGIKSKTLLEKITFNKLIKDKSPYNLFMLDKEKNRINKTLKELGYFNSKLVAQIETLNDNLVNVNFNIDLGKKAKIKKISFIGNKIFKDRKLRRLIISSEYKFWKIISGRKYLNLNLIDIDKRLLKNYYLNNGYYNVSINSSFAKLIHTNEFELIFNIDAKNKFFFGDIKLDIPIDFDEKNFENINNLFKKIKSQPYSINTISKILDEIDQISSLNQYQFIKATVNENIVSDKINLTFKIQETEKFYVKKINIYGNSVTEENVIRNQLEIDEGDPFNEILANKSLNNLKSLNFFKSVSQDIIDVDLNTKILDIFVEEKPTGEIAASAGVGTTGNTIGFGIKENNFLGKGLSLDSNFLISSESFKGKLGIKNPNYKNTDKSLYFNIEALENDNLKNFGYKSNKTGFNIGTNFEYLRDFRLGLGSSNFYEEIETNDTASASQKKQKGNYWDSFLNLEFIYDKRNQKFQTTSGFKSYYSLDLPILSDNNTLKNYYDYSYYFDLFDQNVSTLSIMLNSAISISGDDIKLSERINIPSRKLRGFESGRVGPKDGNDFIGGNYAAAINFSSTIPQFFEESQNVDFLFFIDTANVWGVDYDNALDDFYSGSIRSSTGVALDWFSPIGPLNFSLAYPITKDDGDITETFRFNLGTTF